MSQYFANQTTQQRHSLISDLHHPTFLQKTKSLFKSKTIWGLGAAAVSIFFPQFAPVVDFLAPDAGTVSPEAAEATKQSIETIVVSIQNIVAAVSLMFAGYGRMVADSKIGNSNG